MRERRAVLLTVMAGLLLAGCGTERRVLHVDPGAGSPEGLGATLNVSVEGDSVHLELHVTNVTDGPLVLEYSSSQRYDFAVTGPAGESVFRWSAARSFAQGLVADTLAAGESRRYGAWWSPSRRGDWVASGWLTSFSHPAELHTVFRVDRGD